MLHKVIKNLILDSETIPMINHKLLIILGYQGYQLDSNKIQLGRKPVLKEPQKNHQWKIIIDNVKMYCLKI